MVLLPKKKTWEKSIREPLGFFFGVDSFKKSIASTSFLEEFFEDYIFAW
jgi:hypothetical protein